MYSIISILAATPSVIFGTFGHHVMDWISIKILGFHIASLWTVIFMVSFMIIPTITIMTITSIKMSDKKLEVASSALGANKTQTSFSITLKSARNGIIIGIAFALGRCIAETTAISMVGSPSSMYGTLTLAWWQQSLFLGPTILMAGKPDLVTNYPLVPILTMALIFTSLSMFIVMKIYEVKGNDINIIRKQERELEIKNDILDKYNNEGISSLNRKEQSYLIKYEKRNYSLEKRRNNFDISKKSNKYILKKSSISSDKKYIDYKKSKTIKHNIFIYISSIVGILILSSVFIYLLDGGLKWLTWDTLTMRYFEITYDENLNAIVTIGLVMPIIGTYITTIISMFIAVPLGISLGIFLSTFMKKEGIIGEVASLIFQALTIVPSIVWGTIALLIFGTTNFYENYIGLVPIIFLAIVIIPAIVKTIEESGNRVDEKLKEASYALGATTTITIRRIYLREMFPSIVSSTLLAMSIAIAEATLFSYILREPKPVSDIGEWMNTSSFTLSTLIYNLNNLDSTIYPDADPLIKTTGIVLMLLVLVIAYISYLIENEKYIESLLLFISLFMFPVSLYINEGSILLMILTLILFIVGLFILPIVNKIKRERKVKSWKEKH